MVREMEQTPKMSRRERRRLATRQEILQAARELLLEVGPDELTVRQVARRADFSPASLYTYFSSRDEIVSALLAESFHRLDQYLRRVPGDLPADERVIELGTAYMAFARENPVDLRCILSASPRTAPEGSDWSLGLEAARLIGRTFRDGVAEGVFAATEELTSAEMAYGVWALVHGMVSLGGVDLSEVAGDVHAAPRRVLEAYVARLKMPGSPTGRP